MSIKERHPGARLTTTWYLDTVTSNTLKVFHNYRDTAQAENNLWHKSRKQPLTQRYFSFDVCCPGTHLHSMTSLCSRYCRRGISDIFYSLNMYKHDNKIINSRQQMGCPEAVYSARWWDMSCTAAGEGSMAISISCFKHIRCRTAGTTTNRCDACAMQRRKSDWLSLCTTHPKIGLWECWYASC